MAVQPRIRRRATNLDTPEGPVVPASELHARAYYRANQAKNLAASDEKTAYTAAHVAFEAEKRSRFEFTADGNEGDVVVVEMATQNDKNEVDMGKLYALVASNDITLEQFVSVVSASQADIKKTLGANVLAKVLVPTPQPPKFQIKKKGK